MADSNITKKALAAALKELMEESSFDKINVSDICERCNMNRKSFYYHFKDKYDLVNWIFDTEFIAAASHKTYETQWLIITDICNYFYANHAFYRKALSVSGQNSFSEHLREMLHPFLRQRFSEIFPYEGNWDFQVAILSDAFILSLQYWLMEKEPMPVEELLAQGKIGIRYIARRIEQFEKETE